MPEPTLGPAIDARVRALLPEDGPTLDDVKRHQRAESELLGGVAAGTQGIVHIGVAHWVKDKVIEHAAELARHSFGSASLADKISLVGKAFATFQLACEITDKAYVLAVMKPMERGKGQADASERDRKNLALLMIVQVAEPDVLPNGYYTSECSRVLSRDERENPNKVPAFKSASAILGLAKTDPELARSRDIIAASMREGVTTAYQRGIDSQGAFDKIMGTDASFRSRYESDPAFRSGVKAVVWQATLYREEYDTAVSLSAGYRGSMTRM